MMDIRYFFFRIFTKFKYYTNNFISFIFTLIFIIPALFLRFIKYFIHIRIGCIRNDVMGNSIFNVEYYLCKKQKASLKTFDIFYFQLNNFVVNKQLIKMFKKKLIIFFIFRYLDYASKLLYNSADYKIEPGEGRDKDGTLYYGKKNFKFSEKENEKGSSFLEKIGFDIKKDKFICIIVRDKTYKQETHFHEYADPSHWNYQDFRNVSLENYYDVCEKLLKKGYWVIRMGKITEVKMNIKNDKFLDYSNSFYREDFLDIWLMANCFFSISNCTGLDEVCKMFRKPIVITDMAYYNVPTFYAHVLMCFKKLCYKDSKRLIGLRELINNEFIEFDGTEHFEKKGIELIKNTSEEITETVLEMENKLNNQISKVKESEELNKKFFAIYKSWKNYEKFHGFVHPDSGVSKFFLEKNSDWFLQ